MLYLSYSTVYVGCALYNTAHDSCDSFSLSYTRNKASKMLSTINQFKHGKVHAVHIIVLGMVSINHTLRTIIVHTALLSVL